MDLYPFVPGVSPTRDYAKTQKHSTNRRSYFTVTTPKKMIVFCEDDVGLPQQRAENSRLREIAELTSKVVYEG